MAAQDRLQRRVQIVDLLFPAVPAHKMYRHPAGCRPRLEKCIGDRQVTHRARLELPQRALCAARLALEDADGVAPLQQIGSRTVVQRQLLQHKFGIFVLAHQLGGVRQHRERPNPQQVQLGQPDRLDVAVVILGDQEPFRRPLHRHVVGQARRV